MDSDSTKLLAKNNDFSLRRVPTSDGKDQGADTEKLRTIYNELVDSNTEQKGNQFVDVYQHFYEKIKIVIKKQYLSHFRVALESLLQEKFDNRYFRIILHPRQNSGKEAPNKEDLRAEVRFAGKKYALIRYNENLDEKQLRVILAHEMGHLFQAYLDGDKNTGEPNDSATEPMATFIGVLAIIDKNDFYHNKVKSYQHKNIEDILKDFSFLKPQFTNNDTKSGELPLPNEQK